MDAVSAKVLLQASLTSLDTLARQQVGSSATPAGGYSVYEDAAASGGQLRSSSGGPGPGGATTSSGAIPSEPYLRGAVWLGRNFVMLIEELSDAMDSLRKKSLAEVTQAAGDVDAHRGMQRLSLVAGSSVNEAMLLTGRSKARAREILKVCQFT